MKVLVSVAAIAAFALAACSPAANRSDDASSSQASSSLAEVDVPGTLVDASVYKMMNRDIDLMSIDGTRGFILVNMVRGDLGGIPEAATTIRDVSAAMKSDRSKFRTVKTITLRLFGADGVDLGEVTVDGQRLRQADHKAMNFAAATDFITGRNLTEAGKAKAAEYCADHKTEAKSFCA